MKNDAGPCFDAACECCVAWQELDDARLADIERLQTVRENITINVGSNTLSPQQIAKQLGAHLHGQNPPNGV